MDGSADRDLLASVVVRVMRCDEGELLQLARSLDGLERDRNRKFEELCIPLEGEHVAELEDIDDQDVISLVSVEDYDDWCLRNYGGES